MSEAARARSGSNAGATSDVAKRIDAPRASRDARVWLLIAIVALLPFGAAPELPILIAALWTLASLRHLDWRAGATRMALLVFAAYWLPELLSAFDSLDARKSWLEVAADLRFALLLLFATSALRDAARLRFAGRAVAVIVALWCVDALVQAATGFGLGGPAEADRLSGIFGDDNLKLGGVVAVLSPFVLWWACPPRGLAWLQGGEEAAPVSFASSVRQRRLRCWRALLATALVLAVVLLAGARAAWIMLAIALASVAWRRLGARRGTLALAALSVAGVLAVVAANARSPRFAERLDRTAAALRGDPEALDYALSFRLPIWRTALAMSVAHPFNGIGVRAFHEAYAAYAAPDDHWLQPANGTGAFHAHQWVLEVLSETGALGLSCWIVGLAVAWRAWRHATAAARERAAAPAYALAAMLFPLNTHYAVYSTFWSTLLFALLALWIAALHAPSR